MLSQRLSHRKLAVLGGAPDCRSSRAIVPWPAVTATSRAVWFCVSLTASTDVFAASRRLTQGKHPSWAAAWSGVIPPEASLSGLAPWAISVRRAFGAEERIARRTAVLPLDRTRLTPPATLSSR
eukprot:4534894-Prymnesium_polylepis.2